MTEEQGLDVLLKLRESLFPDLDSNLVKQIYRVERDRQFDMDGTVRLRQVRELIEAALSKLS
jgi:hypothetical protein